MFTRCPGKGGSEIDSIMASALDGVEVVEVEDERPVDMAEVPTVAGDGDVDVWSVDRRLHPISSIRPLRPFVGAVVVLGPKAGARGRRPGAGTTALSR